jgi:hypothetical protein
LIEAHVEEGSNLMTDEAPVYGHFKGNYHRYAVNH